MDQPEAPIPPHWLSYVVKFIGIVIVCLFIFYVFGLLLGA